MEDEFNKMLGIEDNDPTVAFNEAGAELPDVEAVEQEVAPAEPEPEPQPQIDPYEAKFSALESKVDRKLEALMQRFDQYQPQRVEQPQPQPQQNQPPQFVPQRHLTDADLAYYHWQNQRVLARQGEELKQMRVNAELAKLEAAKTQLRSTLGDDVFAVVPEDKINAAFQHAMQHNKFDVRWADEVATAYWRVKGPEFKAKANEFAAKQAQKAEQVKQAQKAVPSGGNRYIPPTGSKPAGSARGFGHLASAFEAELFGNG